MSPLKTNMRFLFDLHLTIKRYRLLLINNSLITDTLEDGFMHTCEFLSSCNFYNELKERGSIILKPIKADYCDSSYSDCARYMVSKIHGPMRVSIDLFPEDMQEAFQMLDELA